MPKIHCPFQINFNLAHQAVSQCLVVQRILMEATPAKWKVFRVICVPGSPTDWAVMAPTASPEIDQHHVTMRTKENRYNENFLLHLPPTPTPPLNVMLILWGWTLLSLSLFLCPPTPPTPQSFSVAGGWGGRGVHQATWVLKVHPVHSTIGWIHRTTGWMLKANSYTSGDWCWHFGAVFHAKGSIHRGRSKFQSSFHTSKVDLLYTADAANLDF